MGWCRAQAAAVRREPVFVALDVAVGEGLQEMIPV
jgi:hypothetical protein